MLILGIETSCDETAASLVFAEGGFKTPRFEILSNIVSSQIRIHKKYGGVVPHLAARQHAKNLVPVLKEATAPVPRWQERIACIAITRGPGLIPSLLVGTNFARGLAYSLQKPLIGVNHLEGHIYSNWLGPVRVSSNNLCRRRIRLWRKSPITKQFRNRTIEFPAICLIVSGGHTELFLMRGYGAYRRLGETRDDAAGESFDKVARILDIGYPGGPLIDTLAQHGDPARFPLPRPMIKSKNYDFSFSGLKTAVRYLSETFTSAQIKREKEDWAASFQEAVVATLVAKTMRAAREFRAKTIMVSGGVSANSCLREAFEQALWKHASLRPQNLLFPPRALTTDNAAMIAMAGYFARLSGAQGSWKTLEADPNLKIR